MSKELFIVCHERAIEEAMEADPALSWDDAYASDKTADRAMDMMRDRYASMADEAKDRAKYAAAPQSEEGR